MHHLLYILIPVGYFIVGSIVTGVSAHIAPAYNPIDGTPNDTHHIWTGILWPLSILAWIYGKLAVISYHSSKYLAEGQIRLPIKGRPDLSVPQYADTGYIPPEERENL